MNIGDAIVKYGTEAVLRYRDVAGLSQDNEVPELYLGGFIAGGIYDTLNVHAHVERFYMTIARELKIAVDFATVDRIGGYWADVAVYQNSVPKAIIELKVFDDYKTPSEIVADRDKMSKLSALCPIETYLGILATDARNDQTYIDRIWRLEEGLGHVFDVKGSAQLAGHGGWKWCFVSARTHQRQVA